jgi:hypothetical protein
MNTGDIYDFLLIMTLMIFASGGYYQNKRETIQTSHKWPLIYSQFRQCRPRLFSSASITVSDRRNRLTPNTIEIIDSLKSWQKIKGVI